MTIKQFVDDLLQAGHRFEVNTYGRVRITGTNLEVGISCPLQAWTCSAGYYIEVAAEKGLTVRQIHAIMDAADLPVYNYARRQLLRLTKGPTR